MKFIRYVVVLGKNPFFYIFSLGDRASLVKDYKSI